MSIFRNLLALIGLVVLILVIIFITRYTHLINLATELDPQAGKVYLELANKLAETSSAVDATIWRAEVQEGMTSDDVEDVMKSVASEHNIKNVGELPLYKEVEAMSGKP